MRFGIVGNRYNQNAIPLYYCFYDVVPNIFIQKFVVISPLSRQGIFGEVKNSTLFFSYF